MSDIRDLLRIYGVSDAERANLEELAIRARTRCWWREYTDIFENEFPGFENDAKRIRVFMPLVLPGLLQTTDYTEAVIRSDPRPPVWRRRALEARLRRQEILSRTDPPSELIAVITEASLMYRWGTRADRRDQAAHLVEVGALPGVRLHLQRFADGPPQGMFSPLNIFDLPDGEPSLVYTETDYAIQEVVSAEEVTTYIAAFDRAVDAALEPAETATYLRQLSEQLE